MNDEVIKLTAKQAISLLNAKGMVHTYRQGGPALIGADWGRANIKAAIKAHESTLQLTGEQARAMKHGMVLEDRYGYLFIETNEEKVQEFEATLKQLS